LPLGLNKKPTVKSLQAWANQSTDEEFTALHFATYHGNYELIKILVEEMHTDFMAKNMYGANVLHIAA
jgi:ankyrin repeat protein